MRIKASVDQETQRNSTKSKILIYAVKMLVGILRALPNTIREKGIKNLGKLILHCAKKTRNRAMRNISHALPELPFKEVKQLAFDAYANCAFGVVESLWLDQLEPEIFCDEATLKILQSGHGACIATMHLGCYEAVPLAINKFSGQSVTLTNMPSFIEHGLQFYANADITAINKNDNNAFAQLLKYSSSNAYISLHCDLYANQTEVNFFNQKTKAPSGVVMIAKMSKKPLLLAYSIYQDDGRIQVFFETVDTMNQDQGKPIDEIMSDIYLRFEEIIKQYPNQWYWSYNRWRTKK
jgi:KDO2-lipid IV(A) lauroyltransferase